MVFGLTELERPVFALLHQDVSPSFAALQPVLEYADAVLTMTAPTSLAALALMADGDASSKRGKMIRLFSLSSLHSDQSLGSAIIHVQLVLRRLPKFALWPAMSC